jgi:hypothetical protein
MPLRRATFCGYRIILISIVPQSFAAGLSVLTNRDEPLRQALHVGLYVVLLKHCSGGAGHQVSVAVSQAL